MIEKPTEERCNAAVPEPPWYIRRSRCQRKATNSGLCKQHHKINEKRIKDGMSPTRRYND
jgi:hypothetical protein